MNDSVSKAEVLEIYADLYDVFDDNKEICKELDKIYDRINELRSKFAKDTNAGDTISREMAIDAVIKRDANCGIDSAEVLKTLPSTQPEIVRCEDCENWDTTWQIDWAKNYHYCPLVDGIRNGNWYCADAERRTDGRD